jgi:hypothetical protein
VGEKLAQLFCQPPKLRRMTDPVTAHALADLSGVTTRTITDLAKHSIAVREGRGNANGLRNCVKQPRGPAASASCILGRTGAGTGPQSSKLSTP